MRRVFWIKPSTHHRGRRESVSRITGDLLSMLLLAQDEAGRRGSMTDDAGARRSHDTLSRRARNHGQRAHLDLVPSLTASGSRSCMLHDEVDPSARRPHSRGAKIIPSSPLHRDGIRRSMRSFARVVRRSNGPRKTTQRCEDSPPRRKASSSDESPVCDAPRPAIVPRPGPLRPGTLDARGSKRAARSSPISRSEAEPANVHRRAASPGRRAFSFWRRSANLAP